MDSSWFQYADPSCTARDLTVEAAQAIGIGKALKSGGPSKGLPFAKLKALLDSRSDRDILDGLRRVIAMIYQNKPCLPYFSSVVKNVANPNIEIKKLVYIYLLQYAESDPDIPHRHESAGARLGIANHVRIEGASDQSDRIAGYQARGQRYESARQESRSPGYPKMLQSRPELAASAD
jgi:hypothetical protein